MSAVETKPSIDFSKLGIDKPSHTVLAIDPGKTSGYCLGTQVDTKLYLAPGEAEISLIQMYEAFQNIGLGAEDWQTHIVYEDFQYRNYARMGLDLTPVKIIGIIELFQERWEPFVTFTAQSAASGKSFYTDATLKDMKVYWGHGKGHARDAMRHLLQWANFGYGAQFIDMPNTQLELVELDWLLDKHFNGLRLFV